MEHSSPGSVANRSRSPRVAEPHTVAPAYPELVGAVPTPFRHSIRGWAGAMHFGDKPYLKRLMTESTVAPSDGNCSPLTPELSNWGLDRCELEEANGQTNAAESPGSAANTSTSSDSEEVTNEEEAEGLRRGSNCGFFSLCHRPIILLWSLLVCAVAFVHKVAMLILWMFTLLVSLPAGVAASVKWSFTLMMSLPALVMALVHKLIVQIVRLVAQVVLIHLLTMVVVMAVLSVVPADVIPLKTRFVVHAN